MEKAIRENCSSVIIDSGAHSFFSEADVALSASVVAKKSKTTIPPDEYFERYIGWLLQFKHLYDYFVELDIGELVGQAKVMAWRDRFCKAGIFDKCVTVYHPVVVSFNDYVRQVESSESRIVALEGDRRFRKRLPYMRLIKVGYDRGVRIHGFALVKQNVLGQYPFYSVDSSSWKAALRFGKAMIANKGKFQHVSFTHPKSSLDEIVGLSSLTGNLSEAFSKTHSVNSLKRLELGIIVYHQMEKYYTELWEARGIDWDTVYSPAEDHEK